MSSPLPRKGFAEGKGLDIFALPSLHRNHNGKTGKKKDFPR